MRFIVIFVLCVSAFGQQWSGILVSSRAIDWSTNNAGVTGGIPTDRQNCTTSACNTVCGSGAPTTCTTTGATVTSSTITAAISSAPNNTVVRIPAGSFSGLGPITITRSNVTLRGMGANQTFLSFSSSDGSEGGLHSADIFVIGYSGCEDCFFVSTPVNWTAHYNQGDTTITLASAANIRAGMTLILSQTNDAADTNGIWVNDALGAGSIEGVCGPGVGPQAGHCQNQLVTVTGVNGNDVTFTPGLYETNWRSGQSPRVWWTGTTPAQSPSTGVGIENLSIDNTVAQGQNVISFHNTTNGWVKGVRSNKGGRNHVAAWIATHITVQDSYFYDTLNAQSQSYGIEAEFASDMLEINNIFQKVTSPVMNGNNVGSVIAYNFGVNNYYGTQPTFMQTSYFGNHDAGTHMNLYEGNIGAQALWDTFHGAGGNQITFFRNYLAGWESGRTSGTVPVAMWANNRANNLIGNVLGRAGYHNNYQLNDGDSDASSIYNLGNAAWPGSPYQGVAYDSKVASSLMRWGNWDVVTATTHTGETNDLTGIRWDGTESSPGAITYIGAQTTPASHTLPASFFLTSKPVWWGNLAWPGIGPDVSNGDIANVGGHANLNPAANCYTNIMHGPSDGSGSILPFDAATCYASVSFNTPNVPQSLQCTVIASATKSAARGTVKVCLAAASPGGFNKPETLYATLPTAYVHNYITRDSDGDMSKADTQPNPICDFSGGFTEADVTLSTITPAGLQTAINLWQGGNRRIKIPAGSVLSGADTDYVTFTGTSPLGFSYTKSALVGMKVISSPTGCLLIESASPPQRYRTICANYPPDTDRPRNPNCTGDKDSLWTIRQDDNPGNGSSSSIYFPPGSNHIIVRDAIATIGPGTSQSDATHGQGHGHYLIQADPESYDIGLEYVWAHGWNPGDTGQPTSHDALYSDGTCKNWTHTGTATTDATGLVLTWTSGDRFGMDWSDGKTEHLYGQSYVSPQATVYLGSTTWHSGTGYLIADHDPTDMTMTCGTGTQACGDKQVTLASAATPNTVYSFNLTNPISTMVPGCGDDVSNGIVWYCDNCWLMWSQINKIHYWATESHGFLGGFANGPQKLAHNWIEPASGGVFLGGGAVDVDRLGPINNFEDRNNFIGNDLWDKYLSAAQGTSPGPPWGCGPLDASEANASTHDTCTFQWSKKAIQEFKFCRKCLVSGNEFQGDWTDGQQICLSFPPRSCSGGAVCEQIDSNGLPRIGISDITFENNWLNNCEQGIGVGARSDGPGNGGGRSTGTTKFDLVNNVFSNFDPEQFGAPYNNMSNGLIELGDNGQSYKCNMSITSGIVHAQCETGYVSGPGTNTQIDRIFRTGTPTEKNGVVTVEFSNRHDPLIGGTVKFTENGTYAGTAVFDGTFTISSVENDIDGNHSTTPCEFDSSTVHQPWRNSTNQPCVGYTGRYADTFKYTDTVNTQIAPTDTLCNKTGGPTCSTGLLGTDSLSYQTLGFAATDISQGDPILVFSGTYADDGGNNHGGGMGCKNADGTSNTGRALDYYTWDTTAKHPRSGIGGSLPLAGCAIGGTPCTNPAGLDVYYRAYGNPANDSSGVVCYVDNGAGFADHVTIQNNTIVNSSALSIRNNALSSQQLNNIIANNVYVAPDNSTGTCAAKKSFFTVPNVASVCEGGASTASFDRATSGVWGNVLMGRSQTYWAQFPSENPANLFPANYAAVGFASTVANQATPCDKSLAPFGCPMMSLPWSTATTPLTLDDLVISGAYYGKGANISWIKAARTSKIYTGATVTVNGPFKDAP